MGIQGLLNYVTNSEPDISQTINVVEEIQNWNCKHQSSRMPLILIDLKEFVQIVVQRDKLGMILGGRYDLYTSQFKKFLDELSRERVKLVFFAKGEKFTDEFGTFAPYIEKTYIKSLMILDDIDGQSIPFIKAYLNKIKYDSEIRATSLMKYNLEKLCKRYGDLHVTTFQHNQELAKYAFERANDVIAVVSNDTDFLVFPGGYQYWIANKINLRELTVVSSCPELLRSKLDLCTEQLFLLGAVANKNYLSEEVRQNFVEKLSVNSDVKGRLCNLVAYVKQQPPIYKGGKLLFDIQQVCRDVYGPNNTDIELATIEHGYNQYNLEFDVRSCGNEQKIIELSKVNNNRFIYKLMADEIYFIGNIRYIDFRNYKSKSYTELVLPILQKLIGILNNDNWRKPSVRKVYVKYGHDEPYKVVEVDIICPSIRLPSVPDLIYDLRNLNLNKTRWSLLSWVLDLDDDFIETVRRRHTNKYTTTLLTIAYLFKQEEITIVQADAILYTEYKVRESMRGAQNAESYPDPFKSEYIRLAHLYTKMYLLVCYVMEVCGLSAFTNFIRFDGLRFHNIMGRFATSPAELDKAINLMEHIQTYHKHNAKLIPESHN